MYILTEISTNILAFNSRPFIVSINIVNSNILVQINIPENISVINISKATRQEELMEYQHKTL
jgi:hypothetical protein